MEFVKRKIKFDNYFVVESVGKSGRLAMLWRNEVNLQLQSYTRWHISMKVIWQGVGNV